MYFFTLGCKYKLGYIGYYAAILVVTRYFSSPAVKGVIIVQSENSIAIKSIQSETPVVSE